MSVDVTFRGTVFRFDKRSINNLLEDYNRECGKSGIYHKDIPYDYWRAFKSADEVIVLRFKSTSSDEGIIVFKFYLKGMEPLTRTTRDYNGIADFLEKNILDSCKTTISITAKLDELALKDEDKDAFEWIKNQTNSSSKEFVIDTVPDYWADRDSSQNRSGKTIPVFIKDTCIVPSCQEITSVDFVSNTHNVYEDTSSDLEDRIEQLENKMKEKKEKNNMKGFNFDFGPCANDDVRMSPYGLAVKNADGNWVSYDVQKDDVMNVDIFNFDGGKFMFKMPMAISNITEGDIVIHNRKPMFVTDVDNGVIKAVDVRAGERKEIMPVKSPFGFNFVTKIVSLFDNLDFSGSTSEANPFGNMLPLFLMNEDKNQDIDPMMLFMMMGNQTSNFMTNPMMMYLMMKNDKMDSDMLPFMMMMMNQPKPVVKTDSTAE